MKVIVAGSRKIHDYLAIVNAIKRSNFEVTELISGDAIGVDKLGERYARANGIPVTLMPAEWAKYNKAAGPVRNRKMAEYADAAVIIWDGKSHGTLNMINEMKRLNKLYFIDVIRENEEVV